MIGTVLAIGIVGRHSWRVVALGDLTGAQVRVVGAVVVACRAQTALCPARRAIGLRGAHDDAVIGVCLDVLLQVLRSLERLATEFALVRL